jgi:hypothetical protein
MCQRSGEHDVDQRTINEEDVIESFGESEEVLAIAATEFDGKFGRHQGSVKISEPCFDLVEDLLPMSAANFGRDSPVPARESTMGPERESTLQEAGMRIVE